VGKPVFAAIAFLAAAMVCPGAILDRVAAAVDGRAITESEVRRTIVTADLQPAPGESAMRFRDRVLSEMIDDSLRYRDALRFSPAPPDASALDAALAKLRQRLRAEGKDPDSEFRRAGMSIEEIRASIEKQLVVSQYVRERFSVLAFVSPEDLQKEYDGPFSEAYRQAGRPVPALSAVEDDVRESVRSRRTADDVDKWTKDLREKARITVYSEVPDLGVRRKVVVSDSPKPKS
jgi:hypothetical protein